MKLRTKISDSPRRVRIFDTKRACGTHFCTKFPKAYRLRNIFALACRFSQMNIVSLE
ncbi:MAG: hypothetical protein AB7F59_14510 [Bdellovibrionales bacterium]